MSSILTNTSAMVALQTLNGITRGLAQTQNEISTGKTVASAKDNAAVWAISKVMESDVTGFKAISDSLALGQSTVAVGRNAAESVTEMLGEVKGKIVAAQEDNVDRSKLQDEVGSLRDQINGVVGAAQFNGQNLLANTSYEAGTSEVDVLASLDRQSDGSVISSSITISKSDLGTVDSKVDAAATYADAAGNPTAAITADGGTAEYTVTSTDVVAGSAFKMDLTAFGGTGDAVYVARQGDSAQDVAAAVAAHANYKMEAQGLRGTEQFAFSAKDGKIKVTNNTAADTAAMATTVFQVAPTDPTDKNTIGGALELLGDLDVTTKNGARAALSAIEHLTQVSIKAGANFGTSEKRMEIQKSFIGKLTDSMKAGIGSMVDTNMEEASAKLQALQVQQQLGVQSLSIANKAPQQLLSLFR